LNNKADLQKRTELSEMWCGRKILGISRKDHQKHKSILIELHTEQKRKGKVALLKLQYLGQCGG